MNDKYFSSLVWKYSMNAYIHNTRYVWSFTLLAHGNKSELLIPFTARLKSQQQTMEHTRAFFHPVLRWIDESKHSSGVHAETLKCMEKGKESWKSRPGRRSCFFHEREKSLGKWQRTVLYKAVRWVEMRKLKVVIDRFSLLLNKPRSFFAFFASGIRINPPFKRVNLILALVGGMQTTVLRCRLD